MPNDEVLSLRVSGDLRGALEIVADRHEITVSDLLRVVAEDVIKLSADDLRRRLACLACGGTGLRVKPKGDNRG